MINLQKHTNTVSKMQELGDFPQRNLSYAAQERTSVSLFCDLGSISVSADCKICDEPAKYFNVSTTKVYCWNLQLAGQAYKHTQPNCGLH